MSSFFIWCVIIALVGLFRGSDKALFSGNAAVTDKLRRFAVVICAHDEEAVIGHILQDLADQDYPRTHSHVFVLADHCADGTVVRAQQFERVTVWERTEGERSSKGAVLNWGMEHILRYRNDFDCVIFFDADNQIAPSFLADMNAAFEEGVDIITARRMSQNPYDSLVSQWYTLYWSTVNVLYNRPRHNLGLSAILSGTGFAFRVELLEKKGWHTCSLSEDVEFTFLENLAGHRVTYLHKAIFYDEQPTRLPVMWTQLRRWCTGDFQIAFRYFPAWLKCFAAAPGWRLWDIFMGVGMTVCFGLTAVSYLLFFAFLFYQGDSKAMLLPTLLSYLATISVGLAAAKMSGWPVKKLWVGIVTFPVFYSLFSYISLQSLLFPQKKWVHIEHKSSKRHF